KREVGERLALWALANDYGQTELVYSGPLFRSMEIKGAKVFLSFDHAEGGLIKRGTVLKGFEIAGQDRIFYPADASISGQQVIVKSNKVTQPVAVRLAFDDQVVHNLFNAAGLPASPFRTDDWAQK
ncbi:MAG: sialate O-acetylesterase, partial [Bacteroidota bacterium]